jgi:hypothetical protein
MPNVPGIVLHNLDACAMVGQEPIRWTDRDAIEPVAMAAD